mgnify:CR=1 FL=1
MDGTFSEVKLFQVKPDSVDAFERLIAQIRSEQKARPGCLAIRYIKRFYVLDDTQRPRQLTRIVKCVRYYSYWEFDSEDSYADAIQWFISTYFKPLNKLLIMPFDINCGYALEGDQS